MLRNLALFFTAICCAHAATDFGFEGSDDDLIHFVTRPDIKAPIFDVHYYDRKNVLPGKWFLAPYANINPSKHPPKYYQPCQTGPAIYDEDGQLIWSGACDISQNQNTCDFRSFYYNDTYHLTAIFNTDVYHQDPKGHAVVMDNSYQITREVRAPANVDYLNMHEFHLLPETQGRTAIQMLTRIRREDITSLKVERADEGWVSDTGFREIDLATNEALFTWWPFEHISTRESTKPPKGLLGGWPDAWEWFHGNSVNKNEDGDYIVSSRWTNAIYKVSGQDGHVLWTLGGKNSTFQLVGFNFSRQHDAQWLYHDPDIEVISFLDNGSDGAVTTSETSSALIVTLDKSADPPYAFVTQRIWRPDGKASFSRGNFQTFQHTENVVVGWSDNAYITEHDGDGNLLLEAQFRSKRFVTYRAYKANFTAVTSEPIAVKAFAFGETVASSTTVVYVSWNGATEVRYWRVCVGEGEERRYLGRKRKTGFETMLQVAGFHQAVYVEAFDSDGKSLGMSETVATTSAFEDEEEDELDDSIGSSHAEDEFGELPQFRSSPAKTEL